MGHFALTTFVLLVINARRLGILAKALSEEPSLNTFSNWSFAAAEGVRRLKKTITSDKLRLSVMVGLEGSGHHYLLASYENMFQANDMILINATNCIGMTPYWTERSMVRSPSSYAQNLERAHEAMKKLAFQGDSLSGPGHISALCHFISYPTDYGPKKVMQYLDLGLLAEVAETEGVDLRAIYLKRSAHEIIVANTVHRNFQMTLGMDPAETPAEHLFMEYVRIILTDIAVVQSMLGELDPDFIICHDYARAGEKEHASKIAKFVAPNEEIAEMYETALTNTWTTHITQEEKKLLPNADVVIARLQRKLDTFENIYCGSGL